MLHPGTRNPLVPLGWFPSRLVGHELFTSTSSTLPLSLQWQNRKPRRFQLRKTAKSSHPVDREEILRGASVTPSSGVQSSAINTVDAIRYPTETGKFTHGWSHDSAIKWCPGSPSPPSTMKLLNRNAHFIVQVATETKTTTISIVDEQASEPEFTGSETMWCQQCRGSWLS